MDRVLYDPEHGYYASGRARIGREGDFFTSVSVGPLFGTLLARQLAEMWERLGAPNEFTLVEQGAHRGELARDILAALDRLAPECAKATRLMLVEPSRFWRSEQTATLGSRARWVEKVAQLEPFVGVHLSNELLDAFPMHLVRSSGEAWHERYVDWQDGRFQFVDGAVSSPALSAALEKIGSRPAGYETEINLEAPQWVSELAARIDRGFVLAIDYGFASEEFFAPERNRGTLRAYAAQRVEPDPLARPGELDLTSHVEF